MIKDYIFFATVDEDTIVVVTDEKCDIFNIRTTNDELKKRFLRFVEIEQEVQLLPVSQARYKTGKGTPLKVAASLAAISSALQFVDIPQEVKEGLIKISRLPEDSDSDSYTAIELIV